MSEDEGFKNLRSKFGYSPLSFLGTASPSLWERYIFYDPFRLERTLLIFEEKKYFLNFSSAIWHTLIGNTSETG